MNCPYKFSMIEFIKSNSSKISIDNPNYYKKEVELILQKIFKCNRVDLYTKMDLVPNESQIKVISNYIDRIKRGEPIQYILNQSHFYGRLFFVDKNVLIPRPDTELIIELLKKHERSIDLLEIGSALGVHTGPGALLVGIQEHRKIK